MFFIDMRFRAIKSEISSNLVFHQRHYKYVLLNFLNDSVSFCIAHAKISDEKLFHKPNWFTPF